MRDDSPAMSRVFGILCVLCASVSPLWADEGLDELDRSLAAATDKLLQEMVKLNPEGRRFTIAAVPLVEPGAARMRKLCTEAPSILSRHLIKKRPEWLDVQERILLKSITEEHKLWVADFVNGAERPRGSAKGLIEGADLLVVGTIQPTGQDVSIELRLEVSRTAGCKAAEQFRVKLTPGLRDLLKYVERGPRGETDDVARVGDILLTVTAQRPKLLGGLEKEWTVKEKEVLCGGDQFNVKLIPDSAACVYIYCYGSDGKATLLFPTDDWERAFELRFGRKPGLQENYCRADWDYTAPGPDEKEIERFFKLDNTPGKNFLYLCAKKDAVPDVQNIRKRLGKTTEHEKRLELLDMFDHVEVFEFSQEQCKKD